MPTSLFTTPHPQRIREIFTRITPRYDLLNSLLSLRLDRSWRRWAVRNSLQGGETSLLDIGTGTGKFLDAFLRFGNFNRVSAIDFCPSMLEKAKRCIPDPRISWLTVDVSHGLPFADHSFDLVSAAFTLRSIGDLPAFFREVQRILNPGGKAVFLELTRPARPWLKILYYPYLKFYLPLVGALVSRSMEAYSFLADSILHFDEPQNLKIELEASGFSSVKIASYSGGIATLLVAVKP